MATFLEFWANRYDDPLETLYESHIGRKLTYRSVMALFEWKNGMKLSPRKRRSVESNYVLRRNTRGVWVARTLPQAASPHKIRSFARKFLTDHFPEGGAIWRIFWLHCCNQRFPIYDQHVHRAMVFIETGVIEDLNQYSQRQKIESYIDRYLAFSAQFSGEQRQIDRSLYTFGRFLKQFGG
jgi:hypothetical protein